MSEETSRRGMRAGAIDCIIKPVDIGDLIERMRDVVSSARGVRGEPE
jgi:DNA-binding response OmpR family regulator